MMVHSLAILISSSCSKFTRRLKQPGETGPYDMTTALLKKRLMIINLHYRQMALCISINII